MCQEYWVGTLPLLAMNEAQLVHQVFAVPGAAAKDGPVVVAVGKSCLKVHVSTFEFRTTSEAGELFIEIGYCYWDRLLT